MNKYLEKIALNRLVKEIAKGNVSATPYSLFQKGALRSPETYAKGARVANDKLQARLGVHVNRAPKGSLNHIITQQGGGYATVPRTGGAHNVTFAGESPAIGDLDIGAPKNSHARSLHGMQHQIGISHELFEADALRRRIPKESIKDRAARIKVRNETAPAQLSAYGFTPKNVHHISRGLKEMDYPKLGASLQRTSGDPVGAHLSLDVLGKESNIIRANPYLAKAQMKDFRHYTGEDKLLHKITGKAYGADKFTGKDLRKLDRAKPDVVGKDSDTYHVPD